MQGRILVIDDEPQVGSLLRRTLGAEGLDVEAHVDPEVGLGRLREEPFDVVITDLRMPGLDGLEVLRRARSIRPECEVVLITAHATVGSARTALKQGAIDYLLKPFDIEEDLLPVLHQVLRDRDDAAHGTPSGNRDADEGVPIGQDTRFLQAIERAQRVARSNSTVLLLGESGSGKEVFANLIHRNSERANKPMLRVNCAALPESLLESELFGHVRGAFTGATRDQKGIFSACDGGILFLDEIGELAPAVQPKLLRVLQQGEFQRIGDAGRVTRVDVRIIAATNRNLRDAVERGAFRDDLYYRLSVVPIEVPPLRNRIEDLPELIAYFAGRLGANATFSEDAMRAMHTYPWPGNIRELANAVEHAVVLGTGSELLLEDLPASIQEHKIDPSGREFETGSTLESIEQRTILQALERTHFNRTEAARLLGVSRRTLGYRIVKFDLEERIATLQEAQPGPTRPRKAPMKARPPAGSTARRA